MEQHWESLATLAKARGLTKQAIHKNLRAWSNRGTPPKVRREGQGKIQKLFILAGEYERLEAEVAGSRGNGTKRTDLNYAREQARKISIEADLKDLELRQRRGELVPTADVTQAAEICAEILRRQLEGLPNRAEEFVDFARGGVTGMRHQLKKISIQLMTDSAAAFEKLGAADGDDSDE